MLFTLSDKRRRLHDPQDHIDLVKRPLRDIDHILAQLVLCLMDARRIQKDDLPPLLVIDRLDPVSRGLRLIARDRDLLPDDAVHERRFPHIRPADQGGEAGFILLCVLILCHVSLRFVLPVHFFLSFYLLSESF